MAKALTDKQRAFAHAFVENGGNAMKAYRSAYDCENSKPATVHKDSAALKNSPHVREYIKMLVERDEFQNDVEFAYITNKLTYIAERSTETVYGKEGEALLADARAAIAAVQELNKMRGNHAPTHTTSTTEVVHGIADVAQAKATLAKHGL